MEREILLWYGEAAGEGDSGAGKDWCPSDQPLPAGRMFPAELAS